MNIKHHSVRDKFESGDIVLIYCSTNHMIAGMLTKALPRTLSESFRTFLNMKKN